MRFSSSISRFFLYLCRRRLAPQWSFLVINLSSSLQPTIIMTQYIFSLIIACSPSHSAHARSYWSPCHKSSRIHSPALRHRCDHTAYLDHFEQHNYCRNATQSLLPWFTPQIQTTFCRLSRSRSRKRHRHQRHCGGAAPTFLLHGRRSQRYLLA